MKCLAPALVAAAALLAAGCNDPEQTPTSPSPAADTTFTGHFVGTLTVGASRFYSFTVTQPGEVAVMLASVTAAHTGAVLDAPLGIGLGRPAGTACAVSNTVVTASALVAQLRESVSAGIHCVAVHDAGTVASDVNFAIRFSYP